MIADKIKNSHLYTGLSKAIAKAFEILKDPGKINKPDGRYEMDGDEIYYIVQHYKTKPLAQGRLEAHKKYIDVQFAAEGREMIGYCPLQGLEIETVYDENKDIAFYKTPARVSGINLEKGMFCVLFPEDAHMPCLQSGSPSDVHKVVVKVKINARKQ